MQEIKQEYFGTAPHMEIVKVGIVFELEDY